MRTGIIGLSLFLFPAVVFATAPADPWSSSHRYTVNPTVARRLKERSQMSQQKTLQLHSQYKTLLTKIKSRRDKLAAEGKTSAELDAMITKFEAALTSYTEQFQVIRETVNAADTNDPAHVHSLIWDSTSEMRTALRELAAQAKALVSALRTLSGGEPASPSLGGPLHPFVASPSAEGRPWHEFLKKHPQFPVGILERLRDQGVDVDRWIGDNNE